MQKGGFVRYLLLFLVSGLFLFCTGCEKGPGEVLIDSFEGKISSKTVDFGSSQGSFLAVSADKKLKVCGEQSIKLQYNLKSSGYMWAARGYSLDVKEAAAWLIKPQDINWPKYNAVSLSMYGSNSAGVIAFDIKDSGGELWRFLLDDDFQGWKELICPFSGFFPRKDWQPENADSNEVLDFPIMSFQFEPRLPGKAAYNFDCIKIIRVK